MTLSDLHFLKTAAPAKLMKLTNGVPWEFCCFIKVSLTREKATTFQATLEAVRGEQRKWMAAGAVPGNPDESFMWAKKGSHVLIPCSECGIIKYPSLTPAGRRFTFSRQVGFGWHNLCGPCVAAFDHHYCHSMQWLGRCEVSQ